MIRVKIPYHLQTLSGAGEFIELDVDGPATPAAVIDALETRYPALRGTVREYASGQRRAYLRFFACSEDISHQPLDTPLPDAVAKGEEPFMIVGAISGG